MNRTMFLKLKASKTLFKAALLLAVAGVLAYLIGAATVASRLPQEFARARQSVSAVSRQIVDLTALTSDRLAKVNLSDLNGETANARALIADARASNAAAYSKAFELTQHLQALAQSLPKVSSMKKQRDAAEAISIELSLVSEFILYTQKVDAFLDALDEAVRTNTDGARAAAADALRGVNEKVIAINALNDSFRRAIGIFDAAEE